MGVTMKAGYAGKTRPLRWHGIRLVLFVLLAAASLGAVAYAASSPSVKVRRCGYVTARYGRSALYPWHMSCAAARKVVVASSNPHAKVIDFGPGWDGGAVRINGQYWVCTGQMGYYNCGYPYRPRKVDGEQGYRGPFTKDVQFQTCALIGRAGCTRSAEFTQPDS
jgi:hypothetical protein